MTDPCGESDRKGVAVFAEASLFFLKYLAVSLGIIMIILVVSELSGLDIKHKVTEGRPDDKGELLQHIVMISLIGPFLEETMFRLWLSFRRAAIWGALFALTYVILTQVILPHQGDVYIGSVQSAYFERPLLKTLVAAAVASCVLPFKDEALRRVKERYGHFLSLLSLAVFSLIHLSNIICAWYIYPFLILACLPQFTLGVSVTYLRLRIGFWAGLLLHCAFNFVTSIPDVMTLLGA